MALMNHALTSTVMFPLSMVNILTVWPSSVLPKVLSVTGIVNQKGWAETKDDPGYSSVERLGNFPKSGIFQIKKLKYFRNKEKN